MEKRGASHIEVIIAFVLFMGFLLVVLYFFNPVRGSRMSDSSLPFLFEEVLKNVSVELETYSVKITDTDLGISDITVVIRSNEVGEIEGNVRVENYYGDEVYPSEIEGGDILFSPEEEFVFVKISEDLNPYSIEPSGEITEDYEISYVGVREIVSEKRLELLEQAYNQNYGKLKDSLNLRGNFDFRVVLSDEEISGERFVPAGLDIYSDYRRIEVLREDGSSEYADMVVRVW